MTYKPRMSAIGYIASYRKNTKCCITHDVRPVLRGTRGSSSPPLESSRPVQYYRSVVLNSCGYLICIYSKVPTITDYRGTYIAPSGRRVSGIVDVNPSGLSHNGSHDHCHIPVFWALGTGHQLLPGTQYTSGWSINAGIDWRVCG